MRNDICTTILWQFLGNFLSHTHIIFLLSLIMFLSPLFFTNKKGEKENCHESCTKWLFKYHCSSKIDHISNNSKIKFANFLRSIHQIFNACFKLGLNMFLVPINILTFCFSPSKIFLPRLVSIKFSIATFAPYFKVNLVFFNEIVQNCVEYCKNLSKKN